MSSRDELREALAVDVLAMHYLQREYQGPDLRCVCGLDFAGYVTWREHVAEACLAVLDQQGWPQEPANFQEAECCHCGKTTTCSYVDDPGDGRWVCADCGCLPDPSAATPVGTASLLGTPLPRMPGARRVPAEPGVDLSDPNDHGLLGGLAMTDTYNPSHPHEPAIPPTFDAEGRCLVCGLLVRCEEAQTERDAALREVAGAEVTHQRLRDQRDEALAALRETAHYEPSQAEAFIRGFEAGAERPQDAGDGDAMGDAYRAWRVTTAGDGS